jgi:hypothetical protein
VRSSSTLYLEEIAAVVHATAPCCTAARCCSTLAGSVSPCVHDDAAQGVPELSGHSCQAGLPRKSPKPIRRVVLRRGQEDPPLVIRHLHRSRSAPSPSRPTEIAVRR